MGNPQIWIDSVPVAKGTNYEWDDKRDVNEDEHFDGVDYGQSPYPKYTVKISRINTYDPAYEPKLEAHLEKHGPIVVKDKDDEGRSYADKYTGTYIESIGGKRDTKSKEKQDFQFRAKTRTRVYSRS